MLDWDFFVVFSLRGLFFWCGCGESNVVMSRDNDILVVMELVLLVMVDKSKKIV